ncbi:MAG: NAD(P)H-binding protein [Candidatus Zixiibacteriota bacterium]|nr:MAG: NAD(P)H-binding protein [candidate division Zixibacteria bacterium]
MKILLLGATGYVGSSLLPRLIRENHQVRCLVRKPIGINYDKVVLVPGDASDVDAVRSAAAGCDTIVYLIHSMSGQSKHFEEIDRAIATNVAAAAEYTGVQQIVYLGGLGNRDQAQTPHLRSRHEVGTILRSSGVPVTELRAAVIIGEGSASFEMIKALVARLPVMICPKWVSVRTQPIAIVDVLEYITRSLRMPIEHSRTIDIGGATILSYRDMMLTVARHMHRRRLIIPVPVLTPWLSSHWVNLVTRVSAPLARALIESVRSETICENDLALRLFDFRPLGFDEAVSRALAGNSPGH